MPDGEGSSLRNSGNRTELPEPDVRVPQVRRPSSPCDRSPPVERVLGRFPLQDGGHFLPAGPRTERRFLLQGGSEGCLPHSPDVLSLPNTTRFSVGRQAVPVSGTTINYYIWSGIRPVDIHQDLASSDRSAETVGISAGCLSGRYTGDRSFSWRGHPGDCSLDTTSVLPGLHREHRQVGAPARARDRLSRFPCLFSQPVSLLDDEEGRQDQIIAQKLVESGNTNAAQFSQLHRQSDSIVARCPTSSTLYEGLTITVGSSSPSGANMEHTSTTYSGSPGRPRMVVQPAQQIQRTTTPKGASSLTDQARRKAAARAVGEPSAVPAQQAAAGPQKSRHGTSML